MVAAAQQRDVGGSGTVRKCADTRASEHHRRANARVFVLGREKKGPTFFDDDLDIGIDFGNDPNDNILLGLDSLMAIDDVTNLFDFE